MYSGNKEKYYKLLDELYKFTKDKMDLIGILSGIEPQDIEEFTKRVQKINNIDIDELLETFIDFRNEKNYKNDDIE